MDAFVICKILRDSSIERGKIKKRKKVCRKRIHYERKFSNVLWHLDFKELYSDL